MDLNFNTAFCHNPLFTSKISGPMLELFIIFVWTLSDLLPYDLFGIPSQTAFPAKYHVNF